MIINPKIILTQIIQRFFIVFQKNCKILVIMFFINGGNKTTSLNHGHLMSGRGFNSTIWPVLLHIINLIIEGACSPFRSNLTFMEKNKGSRR